MLSLHFPKYKNFISETLARKHSISYICHTKMKQLFRCENIRFPRPSAGDFFMLRSSKISLNASLVETRGKDSISSMPLAVYIK